MMLGYWKNDEATEEKFVGDWLKTGDFASVDEETSVLWGATTT